jgi:hypothetical protein
VEVVTKATAPLKHRSLPRRLRTARSSAEPKKSMNLFLLGAGFDIDATREACPIFSRIREDFFLVVAIRLDSRCIWRIPQMEMARRLTSPSFC